MKWPWRAKPGTDGKGGAGAGAAGGPASGEESFAETVQRRIEEDARAAEAAVRHGHRRMIEHWGEGVLGWRDWLSRSPVGVDLLHWWHDEPELTALVGEERYLERLGELLSQAAARDVAAMGLGCTRRVDRACRFAEICSQDPVLAPGEELASHRHGGVAGACSSFIDCHTPHEIDVTFAHGDRHRSVLLFRDHPGKALLWVDGVRVGEGHWLDKGGWWVAERFFVIRIGGPDDHPEQGPAPIGSQLYNIVSLLVHDAERGTTRILVPEHTESWTDPVLAVRDGTASVYPTREDRDADVTPDRVFPVGEPEAGPDPA
ncbi:hypothetical protein AB0O42_12410 [Streptomyces sp. NPDC089922]|uniref:hypothetical protein n=1 Tax=Streptomyces sp. NPDC089922 TaxID=3155189 RepID=UPI0034495390